MPRLEDMITEPKKASFDYRDLTKRELFAMQAMNAWIQHHGTQGGYGFNSEECARLSLECADALLKELEK